MRATTSKRALAWLVTFLILLLLFSFYCPISQAQTATSFTASDNFKVPEFNGSIHFALNGTCSNATYTNGTWTFRDLTLNGSQTLGDLQISTENSNITIYSYSVIDTGFRISVAQIKYYAEGTGKQDINFLANFGKTDLSQWSVVTFEGTKTIWLAVGDQWQLLSDNTIIVKGVAGNLSAVHYRFDVSSDNNLPFYAQHSIIIIVATILMTVVLVGVLIKYRAGGRKDSDL